MCMMCILLPHLKAGFEEIGEKMFLEGESDVVLATKGLGRLCEIMHDKDPTEVDAMPAILTEVTETAEARAEIMSMLAALRELIEAMSNITLKAKIDADDDDPAMQEYKRRMKRISGNPAMQLLQMLGKAAAEGMEVADVDVVEMREGMTDEDVLAEHLRRKEAKQRRGSQEASDPEASIDDILQRRKRRKTGEA